MPKINEKVDSLQTIENNIAKSNVILLNNNIGLFKKIRDIRLLKKSAFDIAYSITMDDEIRYDVLKWIYNLLITTSYNDNDIIVKNIISNKYNIIVIPKSEIYRSLIFTIDSSYQSVKVEYEPYHNFENTIEPFSFQFICYTKFENASVVHDDKVREFVVSCIYHDILLPIINKQIPSTTQIIKYVIKNKKENKKK